MHGEAGSPSDLVRKAVGYAGGETDERHYLRASKRGPVMLADDLTNLIEDDDIFQAIRHLAHFRHKQNAVRR
ncbi:hypothetical protein VIN30_00480 [Adlercreutzia sp. R7]|uniref:Uncharacterized protein n=1 Tax=Adlercreutzia wanghongyangiae TaxID=3111451 RepID=A0ABU6IER8_9ACTN|nr:hypothetical protein [Adlercreutzia sp. R7]